MIGTDEELYFLISLNPILIICDNNSIKRTRELNLFIIEAAVSKRLIAKINEPLPTFHNS